MALWGRGSVEFRTLSHSKKNRKKRDPYQIPLKIIKLSCLFQAVNMLHYGRLEVSGLVGMNYIPLCKLVEH